MVRDLMAIEERQIQSSSTHETHDLEKALERERQNIEREALSKVLETQELSVSEAAQVSFEEALQTSQRNETEFKAYLQTSMGINMDFADAVTFCADNCLLMKTALMQQNILLYPPAKKYVAPAIMPSSWGTLSVKYFSEIRMRMYTAKLRAVGLRSFLELNQPW
ncbi:hypothetical protein L914_03571 [Phytophthora nicotianae]|uniref:Uncharacterized protein n=1 Tax=Phytophthora nicotianae TaxID=4792 RepID=W2NY58_PHYNI|nr:hypothetical protein L914_03571 [Phytophthora nicotianae]